MARARNIKPGFYKNEDLAECSVWARLIFPGLWMLADREGRLEDRPKRIKGDLLPYDSVEIVPLIDELEHRGFLERYQNSEGKFIQITKFATHQTPHYSEKPSVIKPPGFRESDNDEGGSIPGVLQDIPGKDPSLRGGRNPLTPDSGFLTPDSLNPECGEPAHTLPVDYREALKSRPELDPGTVYRKFCGHYPEKKRSLTVWQNWVANERATKTASVSDPDSKASVEALALSRGLAKWDELKEPWTAYKKRVKGVAA